MKVLRDVGPQVTVEYDFADHVKGYEPLDPPKPGIAHLLSVKLESVRAMARAMGFELVDLKYLEELRDGYNGAGDEREGDAMTYLIDHLRGGSK